MTTSRRTFLTGAAAAAVGVGLTPGRAWGDLYTPPNSQTVSKVLEIFMVGGASHRDTCWLEDPDAHANVTYGNWSGSWRDTTLNWSSNIGASGAYAPADGDGTLYEVVPGVKMTGAALPLQGSLLWDRLNVLCMSHHLGPHHPAQALALTGNTIGRPRFAGMGAIIEREFGTPGATPVSWILDTGVNTTSARFAAATGLLGGQYRPPVVPIGAAGNPFLYGLMRAGVSPDQDALLDHYNSAYGSRLVFQSGTRARSQGYDSYDGAVGHLLNSDTLYNAIVGASGGNLAAVPSSPMTYATNKAIEVGSNLLASGARYICVLDHGMGGRDSHVLGDFDTVANDLPVIEDHSELHNRDLWGIFNALREQVDAGTLDLTDTLILIHSEFGRVWDGVDIGTEHWPQGYPAIVIGGGFSSRNVFGDLYTGTDIRGPASGGFGAGHAGFHPTDLRVLALMMAGIDPFNTPDLFLPGETTCGATTAAAALTDFANLFGL